jgi:signal transduction histidine kinase
MDRCAGGHDDRAFLDERGKPYQYMAIRSDITERKRSETLLREQAALARLGEMAAVVAHEVKNPLAGIRGSLQVIGGRMPEASRDRAVLRDIVDRIDSLNNIVQDLLVFARPREPKLAPVVLEQVLRDTAALLQRDPPPRRVSPIHHSLNPGNSIRHPQLLKPAQARQRTSSSAKRACRIVNRTTVGIA